MEALLKQHLYGWHGPLLVNQGFASHIGWALAVPLLGFWLARGRGLLTFMQHDGTIGQSHEYGPCRTRGRGREGGRQERPDLPREALRRQAASGRVPRRRIDRPHFGGCGS